MITSVEELNQVLCRSHITITTQKGFTLKNCSKCRILCLNCTAVVK